MGALHLLAPGAPLILSPPLTLTLHPNRMGPLHLLANPHPHPNRNPNPNPNPNANPNLHQARLLVDHDPALPGWALLLLFGLNALG